MQISTYLGAYLEIVNGSLPSTSDYKGCNSPTCHNYLKHVASNFCTSCGKRVEVMEWVEADHTGVAYYIIEEIADEELLSFCESLATEKVSYLVSNAGLLYSNFYEDEVISEVTDTIVYKALVEFNEKFWTYLVRAQEKFPQCEFKVKFGLLTDVR